jgi:hypothetical protein
LDNAFIQHDMLHVMKNKLLLFYCLHILPFLLKPYIRFIIKTQTEKHITKHVMYIMLNAMWYNIACMFYSYISFKLIPVLLFTTTYNNIVYCRKGPRMIF